AVSASRSPTRFRWWWQPPRTTSGTCAPSRRRWGTVSIRPVPRAAADCATIARVNVHAGKVDATRMRFGIVVGRFNDIVSQRLLEGAVDALVRHGAAQTDITVVWVPGAFEIPVAARELAERGGVDAVICLGAVIRGATSHFEHIAGAAAQGVAGV